MERIEYKNYDGVYGIQKIIDLNSFIKNSNKN